MYVLIITFLIQYGMPCELLILNRIDTDESKGMYGRYDVIVVKHDGWKWGTSELDKNLFNIIKLPNVSEQDAQIYTVPAINKRRMYKFDLTAIAVSDKTTLETTGKLELTTNKIQIANIIKDKALITEIIPE